MALEYIADQLGITLTERDEMTLCTYNPDILRHAADVVKRHKNPTHKMGLLLAICKSCHIEETTNGRFIVTDRGVRTPVGNVPTSRIQQMQDLEAYNIVYNQGATKLEKKEPVINYNPSIEEQIAECEVYIERIHSKILDDPILMAKSDKYLLGNIGKTKELWEQKKQEKLNEIEALRAQLTSEE